MPFFAGEGPVSTRVKHSWGEFRLYDIMYLGGHADFIYLCPCIGEKTFKHLILTSSLQPLLTSIHICVENSF